MNFKDFSAFASFLSTDTIGAILQELESKEDSVSLEIASALSLEAISRLSSSPEMQSVVCFKKTGN
jgi:hypothetical protein